MKITKKSNIVATVNLMDFLKVLLITCSWPFQEALLANMICFLNKPKSNIDEPIDKNTIGLGPTRLTPLIVKTKTNTAKINVQSLKLHATLLKLFLCF